MKHKNKRITAFLVFFATLFSLIPLNMKFNEREAKADVINKEITVVGISTNGLETAIKVNTGSSTEGAAKSEFKFEFGKKNVFVGVNNGISTDKDGTTLQNGTSGIYEQKFTLENINGVDVTNCTFQQMNEKLSAALGCRITVDGVSPASLQQEAINNKGSQILTADGKNLVGINIEGLPYGVNTISYKLTESTVTKDQDGNITRKTETYPSGTSETITIYHGTKYLSSTIDFIESISYIGANKHDYNNMSENDKQNNKTPFKYNDFADEDKEFPLKYTFNVPDSTLTLDYAIHFQNSVSGTASLLLNGASIDSSTSGNVISGSFESIFDSAILVIKFDNNLNQDNIIKSYALQINCNQLGTESDYTLRDAGIVKYEYDADEDVPAYIGKEFKRVDQNSNELTYEGNLYVDPRAKKISINPVTGVSEGNIVFKYKNEDTVMKDGKLFVDFSGTNKTIIMEGFQVVNGTPNYSKVLVRYKFNVIQHGNGDASNINIDFGNTAYLTQPGRETKIPFDENRYVYNLYSGDRINVSLLSPQTAKNEYIKVFFANSTTSTQLTEANKSVENSQGDKKPKLTDINVGSYEKMVIKVYYDKQTTDSADSSITNVETYEIGHEYVFYIMKNVKDENRTEDISSDATLKDLTVKDGKLVDTDGNKGFTSDQYAYTVTVPKDNNYAEVTAVSNTDVKEITATIKETGDSYDMTSGKAVKLPLNDSGTTTIKIEVTATDGVSVKTYTVIVENNSKSSDCTLENLIVTPGEYEFDPDKKKTKVRVDIDIKEVEVTPVPSNEKSRVYVDDKIFSGSAKTIDLRNEQEVEVEIEVVSEDGTKSNSYTVVITRRDVDDVDNDDGKNDSDVFYDEYNDCWIDTSKYEEWGKINGKDVYFDKNGRQVKDSWITTGKYGKYTYYYLNDKGYKYTGWLTDSTGKKYFLDQDTGSVHTGYLNENNVWYYFDQRGVMKVGWLYDATVNNWKYFLQNGQMVTNTTMSVDGKVYNFGIDGFIY